MKLTWKWQGNVRVQVRKSDDGTWAEARFNENLFVGLHETLRDEVWQTCLDEAKSLVRSYGFSADSLRNIEIEKFTDA